jgi:hypothetical protein
MTIKSEEMYSILHSIELLRVDGNLTGKEQSFQLPWESNVFIQDTEAKPHDFHKSFRVINKPEENDYWYE